MSYQVKIRRESRRPDGFADGPYWVARDDRKSWRSYCKASEANGPAEAARAMFHANEIGHIGNNQDGTATVEILHLPRPCEMAIGTRTAQGRTWRPTGNI